MRNALEGSPSTLGPEEIIEPARLAAKLAGGDDPIAAYIRQRRAEEARNSPAGLDGAPKAPPAQSETLVNMLNRVIQNAELYRGPRGEHAPLTERMLEFIQSSPRSRNVARLNRKLLEMAFPDEIAPCADGDPLLRVLFAMREDYIAEIDPYVAVLPEQLQIRYRLERLRERAAHRAITGPVAALKDRGLDARFDTGAAEALVENLMGGEEFVEPVQLQVVSPASGRPSPNGMKLRNGMQSSSQKMM